MTTLKDPLLALKLTCCSEPVGIEHVEEYLGSFDEPSIEGFKTWIAEGEAKWAAEIDPDCDHAI